MQGEEKLQGEKNADTHFFFQRAMGQQFEAHKTIYLRYHLMGTIWVDCTLQSRCD